MTHSMLLKALLALALSVSLLPAQTANPKPPKTKGKKENAAVMAIFQAQTPDARITAATAVVEGFVDSDYRATALDAISLSYMQKGDVENTIIYAEKCLEADPKYYDAMLMIASTLAQRTKEFDLDKDEKLTRATKMANAALELIPTSPKPNPNIPDDQWEAAKKDYASRAHEALGLIAIVKKDFAGCVSELKTATDATAAPDPSTEVRLANCQIKQKQYDDALVVIDKVLADPLSIPQVKAVAVQLKMDANKGKAAAK